MFIQIDLSNPKPAYLQIVDLVRRAIATGVLVVGDRLPAIREVAIQARVNRNTVSRSYQELERQGLVHTRQGSGCYVSENGPGRADDARAGRIKELAAELALEAHLSEIDLGEVTRILEDSAAELRVAGPTTGGEGPGEQGAMQ